MCNRCLLRTRSLLVLVAALALVPLVLPAATLIETDRTLGAGDLSLEGDAVTVSGATLTLEGDHSLASLTLTAGATVVQAGGTTLTVSGELRIEGESTFQARGVDLQAQVGDEWVGRGVTIEAGSVVVAVGSLLTADGFGYAGAPVIGTPGAGPAGGTDHHGGGHGGRGGALEGETDDDRAPVYGSAWQPLAPGSGSGGHNSDNGGAAGGGAIHLVASTLQLDGEISADGLDGAYNAGGGAGGSVWIEVGDFTGTGSITADGGAEGYWGYGGSGAGGRVAVHVTGGLSFPGANATAEPGSGYPAIAQAEEGTVAFFDRSGALPGVTVFRHFTFPADIPGDIESLTLEGGTTRLLGGETLEVLGMLTVADGAILQVETRDRLAMVEGEWIGAGGTLDATSVVVAAGGLITADGLGYAGAPATGTVAAGPAGGTDRQGGGHGGRGGATEGFLDADRTPAYDSAWQPREPGSGGGAHDGSNGGGPGGGSIHLIADSLVVDGEISADGLEMPYNAGGGAGGSLWIEVGGFSGSGQLTATGGDEGYWGSAASGAGGRIAVHHTGTRSFPGANADVSAGDGFPAIAIGEHGTAAFYDRSGVDPGVEVHTHFTFPGELPGPVAWLSLEGGTTRLLGGETLEVLGTLTVADGAILQVETRDRLAMVEGEWMGAGGTLDATSVVVAAGGLITADGQGYAGAPATGTVAAGPAGGTDRQGGGHGGRGGATEGFLDADRTPAYDSAWQPREPGSGGGAHDGSNGGGPGGGSIHLIADSLVVDGEISADGLEMPYNAGGGAGGSLWIEVGGFSGSGQLTATGGDEGYWGSAASGAGGRIAVHHTGTRSFPGANADVSAGDGFPAIAIGEHGTAAFYDRSGVDPGVEVHTHFTFPGELPGPVAWLSLEGGTTRLLGGETLEVLGTLTVADGAILQVETRDRLAMVEGEWMGAGGTLDATSVVVAAGGLITADGQGYAGAVGTQGIGAGPGGGARHIGGAHGGSGGVPEDYDEGERPAAYGSYWDPVTPGSGGGAHDGDNPGLPGGGAIHLACDQLVLDGEVSADGLGGLYNAGGGAGGSIWIEVSDFSGSGSLSAVGGAEGHWGYAGSGAGGRIAVHYDGSLGIAGASAVASAGSATPAISVGEDGTVAFFDRSQPGRHLTVFQTMRLAAETDHEFGALELAENASLVLGGDGRLRVAGALTLAEGAELRLRASNRDEPLAGRWSGLGGWIEADTLTVAAGSSITASGEGYRAVAGEPGRGPGGGPTGGGGGHGGAGGKGHSGTFGGTYGDSTIPMELGSSGGGNSNLGHLPGSGGGAIFLRAGTLLVDGSIEADGTGGRYSSGGGAGGSILLDVGILSGSGTLSAEGGDGVDVNWDTSGGGGGRIAIYHAGLLSLPEENLSVEGGYGYPASDHGQPGSIQLSNGRRFVWARIPAGPQHGIVSVRPLALGALEPGLSVGVSVEGDGFGQALAEGLAPGDDLGIDTTALPDGVMELVAAFTDASGRLVGEARAPFGVNNADRWHFGEVAGSETWAAGEVHLVDGRLSLLSGAEVTVEAGAIVKLLRGSRIELQDGSAFTAAGTAGAPIVFTSIADDAVAGDTNRDGDASAPAAGDWDRFEAFGEAVLSLNEHVILSYSRAVHRGELPGSTTWAADVVHHVETTVTVPAGATLTIEPGAVVRFASLQSLHIEAGATLLAEGTRARPIVLTSDLDPSGGAAVPDGGAPPAAGDWRSLIVRGVGRLEHVQLRYGAGTGGGWEDTAMLKTEGEAAQLTVESCWLNDALFDGIGLWGGTAAVTNTVVAGSDRGILVRGGDASITHCTLHRNRLGVHPHGGASTWVNNIIAASLERGMWNSGGIVRFAYNDVWSTNGVNYYSYTDPTGTEGNLSVDPAFGSVGPGGFRPGFASPVIDAADGTASGTTDALGSPRYDDPRSENAGIPTPGGNFADLGAFEFVEGAESDLDLVVTRVSGPAAVVAGETAELEWTVRNQGTVPVEGPWEDEVGLIHDDGTILPAGRVLVADGRTLVPGGELVVRGSLPVPGGLIGDYRWLVDANVGRLVFEGTNSANNRTVGTGRVSLDLRELTVGSSLEGSHDATLPAWFKMIPGSREDVLVSVDSAAATGSASLAIGVGRTPVDGRADFTSPEWNRPDVSALVPSATRQVHYLVLRSDPALGGTPFEIRAEVLDFSLSSVTPGRIGHSGPVTLEVRGGGFDGATEFFLVSPSSEVFGATLVRVLDGSRAFATFDLGGAGAGPYDLRVGQAAAERLLEDAVEVVRGSPGQLQVEVALPEAMRSFSTAPIYVTYRNTGDTDVLAPFFMMEAEGNLDPWNDASSTKPLFPEDLGSGGVLRPGQSGTFRVVIDSASGDAGIGVGLFGAGLTDPSTPMNWDGIADDLRPFYVPEAAWPAVFANFRARVGETFGQFNQALAASSAYLSGLGAQGIGPVELVGYLMQRSNLAAITLRHTDGSLGYGRFGWWEIEAIEDPGRGDVLINHAGRFRLFRRVQPTYALGSVRSNVAAGAGTLIPVDLEPEYRAMPGDAGRLTRVGGAFRLTEETGTEFFFDTSGRWTRIVSVAGEEILGSYDGGNLVRMDFPNGDVLTFDVNARGHVERMHEPGGTTVDYTYDAAGDHVVAITDTVGTVGYSYIAGRGPALEHAVETVTTLDGSVLELSYSNDGEMLGIDGPNVRDRMSFVHHADGSVETLPERGESLRVYSDHVGNPGKVVVGDGREFRFHYDSEHRPIRTTGPNGLQRNRQFGEWGNLTSVTNSAGEITRYAYSQEGHRLDSVTDPRGNATSYAYDANNRVTGVRFANGSGYAATYGANGRVAEAVNARGLRLTYAWDARGRIRRVDGEDGSFVAYTWNDQSNLVSVENGAGRTDMSYNAAGRLTRVDYPDGKWVKYTYNAAGRRSRLETHAGLDLQYDYGPRGQLMAIREGSTTHLVDFVFDEQDRLVETIKAGGARTEYLNLGNGKTSRVVHRASDGGVLESFECGYDALGQMTSLSTLAGSWSYGYDPAGRLIEAEGPEGTVFRYAYDANGNRVMSSDGATEAYSTNRLDQYTAIGDRALAWDADGNLVSDSGGAGATVYAYDIFDRLVRVETGGDVWGFEYDAMGNRSAVIHNGERREYLHDPSRAGSVIGEFDGSGTLVAHYASAAGPMVRLGADGQRQFYAYDPRGNTRLLTTGDGTVVNAYEYSPFGVVETVAEAVETPFQFGGAFGLMQDAGELVFARNRFLSPRMGRFVHRDPVLPIGQNLYAYANNDPVNFTDFNGLNYWLIEGIKWAEYFGEWGAEYQLDGVGKYVDSFKEDWPIQLGQAPLKFANVVFEYAGALAQYPARLEKLYQILHMHKHLGNLREARHVYRLIQHQEQAGRFISGGSKLLGRTLGLLGTGLAYRSYWNTVMKYGEGKASGYDVVHDGGVFAGSVIGLFNPLLGGIFAAWDWGTYHVSLALFERFPNLGQDWFGEIPRVGSYDPNDIAGPAGAGEEGWIQPAVMNYRIRFENDAEMATAAAQVVRITLQLDEDLDGSTFRVGEFGFGELTFAAPPGMSSWSGRVDARDAVGLDVELACDFDPASGVVTWTLTSIDPDSGLLTLDPFAGFLPPNEEPPEGDGFVTFSVEPRPGVPLETLVLAQAEIIFDTNEPILTNVHRNTLDPVRPSAGVVALPSREGSSFLVSWAGSDAGAGLATYDVHVSDDGGPFVLWLDNTEATSAVYHGEVGHEYAFEVVGTDAAGNVEHGTATAEGSTTVVGPGKGYMLWRSEAFTAEELGDPTLEALLWGDDADPDWDSYLNLWEYFMGTDPRVADPPGLIALRPSPGGLTLRYRHSLLAPVVDGIPERSDDLQSWSDGGVTDQAVETAPAHEEREATVPMGGDRDFLRLRFER
mgnify:CR=1 FL=1